MRMKDAGVLRRLFAVVAVIGCTSAFDIAPVDTSLSPRPPLDLLPAAAAWIDAAGITAREVAPRDLSTPILPSAHTHTHTHTLCPPGNPNLIVTLTLAQP